MNKPSKVSRRLADLYAKRPNRIEPGLQRIKLAWQQAKMHEYQQKNILIAGTNGKGSSAGFIFHKLVELGCKVGLFTSPHLRFYSERIQCSDTKIDDDFLMENLDGMKSRIEGDLFESLSFFEVTTLLGLYTFNKIGCEFNVLEVGLGGRLDACNVVNAVATVVTSIDLDHTEWLGDTLEQIAGEKLGISKPQAPMFWAERFTEAKGLQQVVSEFERKHSDKTFRAGVHFGYDPSSSKIWRADEGAKKITTQLSSCIKSYSIPLLSNYALADFVTIWLASKFDLSQSHQALTRPDRLKTPVSLIGRFQKLKLEIENSEIGKRTGLEEIEIILDVCHNPASAKEFGDSLLNSIPPHSKIPALVTILRDKDLGKTLDQLRKVLEPIFLFSVDDERSMRQKDLPARHSDLVVLPSLESAWGEMIAGFSGTKKNLAICGSFFAVAQALDFFSVDAHKSSLGAPLAGTIPQ